MISLGSVSINFVILFTLLCGIFAEAGTERHVLGRAVKLRVLVDKVMQEEEGWIAKEWMIREARDAGFNVYSPRRGFDRLEDVQQVSEWCRKYGIFHMPWMRGSLPIPSGPAADGKRYTLANGKVQQLWSPNSDEFWAWISKYIIEYAKLSARNPHLIGIFLDFENYSPGHEGNCYTLSYDDLILSKFARSFGIKLPSLAPPMRKPWLEEMGLHPSFAEFQISQWRERCRALRREVDRFNRDFQFCIYPAPGTLFMVQACYHEWSSATAPIILADPKVYGRPREVKRLEDALRGNREILLRNMEVPKEAGILFLYMGGVDPATRGADPEFCARNALMISEITSGYWVFYEGPKYKETHREYFKWFTWANRAISGN